MVLLTAHRQDRVAHDQTDRVVVGGGREDPVVAEPAEHAVITEQHPLVARSQFLRHPFGVHEGAVPDRIGAPHVLEEEVRAGFAGEVKGDRLVVGIGAQRHCRS
jgi:hypothetical protein